MSEEQGEYKTRNQEVDDSLTIPPNDIIDKLNAVQEWLDGKSMVIKMESNQSWKIGSKLRY